MTLFEIESDGRDVRWDVENLLMDNHVEFDSLESPRQRANGSETWLAELEGEPVAEIKVVLVEQQ